SAFASALPILIVLLPRVPDAAQPGQLGHERFRFFAILRAAFHQRLPNVLVRKGRAADPRFRLLVAEHAEPSLDECLNTATLGMVIEAKGSHGNEVLRPLRWRTEVDEHHAWQRLEVRLLV